MVSKGLANLGWCDQKGIQLRHVEGAWYHLHGGHCGRSHLERDHFFLALVAEATGLVAFTSFFGAALAFFLSLPWELLPFAIMASP